MRHNPANLPGLAEAPPDEKAKLWDRTARERAWYAGWPRFATNADILAAADKGGLSLVRGDDHIMPVGRLRNRELREEFPPYLLKGSFLALRVIGGLWEREMEEMDLPSSHRRLAVTSLARSVEYQNRLLLDPAKLASPDSTHCVAASFDIDASGYYQYDGEGKLWSIVHPGRDKRAMQAINNGLKAKVSTPRDTRQTSEGYDGRVIDALLNVAYILHEQETINHIVEYAGTGNQCLHIAPNPAVFETGRA